MSNLLAEYAGRTHKYCKMPIVYKVAACVYSWSAKICPGNIKL